MKSRIQILLVALVCFGPVIGAYLLYYAGDLGDLPRLENPERRLLQTPAELPALPGRSAEGADDDLLSGTDWTLLYARTTPCGERCRQELIRLRQVHLALGRDQDRVRRVFVGPQIETVEAVQDPMFSTAGVADAAGAELLGVLEQVGHPPGAEGRIYVVDPHGNLVMSYPPDADQEGLLEDLERLLSVSRIG